MARRKGSLDRRRIQVLERVVGFIAHISNLRRLLERIMDESKAILDAEASSLLLYDPKERVLFFEVATGSKGERVKRITLRLGQGIAGACAKERKVINVADAAKDPRFFREADRRSSFTTRNILATPIIRKGRLLGVLEVLNKRSGRAFDAEDVRIMDIIAAQAGLAIENAYLYRENLKKAGLAGVGQTMLSLSHDIKNILNGLLGGISLVDAGLKEGQQELVTDGWGMVKKNVAKVSDLILDMLNYSSKKKPYFQKVDIASFLRETGSVYEAKMRERGCELRYEMDPGLPDADFDEQGLQRALLNLFTNAFEIVADGTGCVTLGSRRCADDRSFQLYVSDNGPGIPPKHMKRMFELFFTTKGHKGTGLGLPVVRKIVREHGGTVAVESAPGQGACFTITLPIRRPIAHEGKVPARDRAGRTPST